MISEERMESVIKNMTFHFFYLKYLKESLHEFEAFPDGGGLNNGEGLELPLVALELFLLICSNESKNDPEDDVLKVSNTKNGSS